MPKRRTSSEILARVSREFFASKRKKVSAVRNFPVGCGRKVPKTIIEEEVDQLRIQQHLEDQVVAEQLKQDELLKEYDEWELAMKICRDKGYQMFGKVSLQDQEEKQAVNVPICTRGEDPAEKGSPHTERLIMIKNENDYLEEKIEEMRETAKLIGMGYRNSHYKKCYPLQDTIKRRLRTELLS